MSVYAANFTLEKGTDFETELNLTEDDGSPLNLVGYIGSAKIRKYPTSPKYKPFTITFIDRERGRVKISLSNTQTAGSFITYSSGTTYNGSTSITISANGSSSNTANTLVARDSSGDFTTGTITGSAFNATTSDAFRVNGTTVIDGEINIINAVNGSFSGIVTATEVNATSDINLKKNIHTVDDALETIGSLRGVSFDWKDTGKSSYGVIAQELEEVLPELVKQGEVKSVNYNGLIGVLIEAIKELKAEIEELKSKS